MLRTLVLALVVLTAARASADNAPPPPATADAGTVAPATPDKPLLIGLERTLSDDVAKTEGRSVAGYLSAALKQPVKARIFQNYDDLADALGKGQIDLAWINPLPFVKASQQSAVFPVAKAIRRGTSYHAVYFVKAESKAKALTDLKGLKVAWVDPSSAAGYVYPKGMLLKARLPLKGFFANETFVGTHKAVCEAVLAGTVDVGATFLTGDDVGDLRPDGCIETLGPDVAAKLRGVVASDGIPSEVIAARAGLDAGIAAKLTGIFAQMSETEAGQAMLKTVFRAEGFGFPMDNDYDGVRAYARSVTAGQWIEPGQDAATTASAPGKKRKGGSKKVPPAVKIHPH